MLDAFRLDRTLALRAAQTANDPNSNELIETWSTYATVRAFMEHHSGPSQWTEGMQSAREFANFGLYFTIRYRDDVSSEHRIIFDGSTYEIIGRPREIGRRKYLKVQVRLVE